MCNLLQNPSFEAGLNGWVTNNVSLNGLNPYEGTHSAEMNTGLASMYQDVTISGTGGGPLLLSFEVFPSVPPLVIPAVGNLLVEVIWQNASGNPIGTGLRLLIPNDMLIINRNRLTYVDITDRPPAAAAKARLQFSKGDIQGADGTLQIDQVVFAPVNDINLVQNPGFQARLFGWMPTNATAAGTLEYEGTIYAELGAAGLGEIYQDIPIGVLPAEPSFLLSFATRRRGGSATLSVTLDYRDDMGSLGTGLSLLIPNGVYLEDGWKTFAVATETAAPVGTTTVRITFSGGGADQTIQVDKVILSRVETPNLLINPSFESGLVGWISENTIATSSGGDYEGLLHARVSNVAYIFQDVNISPAAGCCFLLTFGAQGELNDDALVEVIWLNAEGREFGLATSLVIPNSAILRQSPSGIDEPVWTTFVIVTEQSPPEAAAARIRFSVPNGSTLEIDLVSFTRMFCPPPPQFRGVNMGM